MIETTVPSREIMWNVSHPAHSVLMYLALVVALVVGVAGIWSRVELWGSGQKAPEHQGRWQDRFYALFTWGALQKGTNRSPVPAIFHTLIYVGFLVLLFTTTMVFLDHDLGIRIYHGDFYLAVTVMSDLFGLGALIGVLVAVYRRYGVRPDLLHNRVADSGMLGVIALLLVQGFILEGLRIQVTQDPWASYSPVGLLVAKSFWFLSENGARILHVFVWWFHTLTVFAGIALLPYSKFFHIVSSSANLFFRDSFRPKGALRPVGDLETLMESGEDFSLGNQSIKDYSWKELLDLDACTSCGRCQDNCPAYIAGKPLSPKWMILDTRNHALALHAEGKLTQSALPSPLRKVDAALTAQTYLASSGIVNNNGVFEIPDKTFRAENVLVQEAVFSIGGNADARIAGEVMDQEVFWSCTTCRACVEVCPVGIHHVDQIMANRRNMALMHGEIPQEAQATLRALETRGNPYGNPADRMKWALGLDVPIVQPGDSVEYLYWVGCVSAFDPRKQKIAQSLVTLMKKAGLSFGVLGTAEGCSGDPARRLGEENIYQLLSKQNLEILKSIKFSTLVANCPHCFNTIKNEYPEFGNLGEGRSPEIIHHSVLLKRLLKEGKIELQENASTYTFHDPCYLGRYNDEYEAPRDNLRAIKSLKVLEMDRSKETGMCCGAGGGHFWMDRKVGERINAIRVDQARETGAEKIATACPFCMQMLEDGIKIRGYEDSMQVKDIAEVLVENLR